MALIEIRKDPSRKELAWFGLMMAAFLGVAGLVARHRFGAASVAAGLWSAAVAVPALYYAVPATRRPIYLGWVRATLPIGFVVSHALLGLVYFVGFTAVGALLRLKGRDPMSRRLEPSARTYWSEHRPCDAEPGRYFRQY